MNKYLAVCGILSAFLSTKAYPEEVTLDLKPYVGADYQYTHIDYSKYPQIGTPPVFIPSGNFSSLISDSLHGFEAYGGLRIGKFLGVESGYLWTGSANKNATVTIIGPGLSFPIPATNKIHLEGPVWDAMGYLPITDDKKFELVGTVGISDLTRTLKTTFLPIPGGISREETELGYRLGGGIQYALTDHLNARTIIRYQSADYSGLMDNAILVNIGLNYQF